jgi:hypothetical protein
MIVVDIVGDAGFRGSLNLVYRTKRGDHDARCHILVNVIELPISPMTDFRIYNF